MEEEKEAPTQSYLTSRLDKLAKYLEGNTAFKKISLRQSKWLKRMDTKISPMNSPMHFT